MSFETSIQPYVARVLRELQLPSSIGKVIEVQLANESARGSSEKAKQNNLGGIKYSTASKTAIKVGDFAAYKNLDDFFTDYIRVLRLSYYDNFRNVAKGGNVSAAIVALGQSPYDAGHYALNGVPGGKLLNMLGLQVAGGSTNGASSTALQTTVEGMQTADLKKYAAIGLGVVGVAAVASFFKN